MKILLFICALLFSLSFIGMVGSDSFFAENEPISLLSDTLPEEILTDSIPLCGTSAVMENLMGRDTAMQQRIEAFEDQIYEITNSPKRQDLADAKVRYTLPVVVHVVTENGVGYISNQEVQQGIARLNQGFANKGSYDRGTGADMDIRFALATKDPNGQSTSGITRVTSHLTNLTEVGGEDGRALANLRKWDQDCYINIWVVNNIPGAAGYATYPWTQGSVYDGVVVRASTFTGGPSAATTIVHELGHYLGLYHTFEGGCTNWDCTRTGDRVCDTPPDGRSSFNACNQFVNSCSTDTQSGFSSDQPDMISNYMDYTSHSCRHDFTPGQGARMRATIRTTRSGLTECDALVSPCFNQPVVNINLPSDSIVLGVPLNITSTNESTIRVNWYINGESISTDEAFEYTFEEEGTYTLLLRGEGSSSFCSIVSDTRILTVYCPTQQLDYSTELVYSDVESPIELKVFPEGISNWEWWLDGEPTGLTDTVERVYLLPGTYTLELKTLDGSALCDFVPPAPFELEVPCPGNLASIEADPDQVVLGDLAIVDLYSGNLEYIEWFVNGVSVGDPDPLEYTFTEPGIQEVVFFGKNPLEGCADYRDTVYIEVLCPFSNLDIQQPADSVEVGNTLTFPVDVANSANVIWSVNGISIPGTENNELVYTFTEAGFYEIAASASHAEAVCGTVADTVQVWSYCSNAPIAINIPATYVKVGEAFQLSADATGLSNLHWYIDGEKVGEGETLDYSFFDPAEYEIRVTGERGDGGCAVASGITKINAYCRLFGGIVTDRVAYAGEPLELAVPFEGEWDSVQWRINGVPLAVKDTFFSYQFDVPGYYDVVVDVFYKGCIANMRNGSGYYLVKNRCQYEDAVGYWQWENAGNKALKYAKGQNNDFYLLTDRRLSKVNAEQELLWSTAVQLDFTDMIIDEINGGVLVVANFSVEEDEEALMVMKFSETGQILWKRELKGNPAVLLPHRKVIQISTGEFLLLSSGQGETLLSVVNKLSNEGDLIWSKPYEKILGLDLIAETDGSIYLASRTVEENRVSLSKLDAGGTFLWSRIYFPDNKPDNTSIPIYDRVFVRSLNEGKLGLSFSQNIDNTILDPHICVVNGEGNLEWVLRLSNYYTNEEDAVFDFEVLPTGDMVLLSAGSITTANNSNYSISLSRLDLSGKMIWNHRKSVSPNEFILDITHLEEDKIALSGWRDNLPSTQILDEFGFADACNFQKGIIDITFQDFAVNSHVLAPFEEYSIISEPFQGDIPMVDFSAMPDRLNACVVEGISSFDMEIELLELLLCGDKVLVEANICNNGNIPNPEELKVSFYAKNPLHEEISQVSQSTLRHVIQSDTCKEVTFLIPQGSIPSSHLFVFINDDGNKPAPFDLLDDPPNENHPECNVFDNLDSIAIARGITVPFIPLNLGPDQALCEGETIVLSPSTAYDSYHWEDNSISASRSITAAGLYILEATNECGQVSTDSVLVTAIFSPPAPDLGPDFLYCEDQDILLRAGSGYESYLWQNGSTDSTFTVSQAGRYWVEVTDECGISYTDTIVIELEQFVPVNLGPDRQICEGDTLILNAGLGFATYHWTATTAIPCQDCEELSLSPTSNAHYEVVTTLQSGCVFTDTIFVEVVASVTHEEVRQICAGESTLIFDELQVEPGRYSRTFQSTQSCDSTVHIDLQVVEEIQASATVEPSCFQQNTGEITLSIAGGLPPYTIEWEDGSIGRNRSALVKGNYAYTILDDFGCSYAGQIEVPEKEEIHIDLDWEDPFCEGEASGSISVTAIEGELLFSLDGQEFQESGTFEELPSGDYNIWIRDLNGCERTTIVQLVEPEPLMLEVPPSLSINQGDTIPIVIGGETNRITSVQWTPAEGLSCTDCLNPLAFPDADIVYEVSFTDDQGCQLSTTITVEVEVVSASSQTASIVGLDPPTAFSPNGDGVNDRFEILGLERFPKSNIVVLDRWGKVVYQANPYGNDWDGRTLAGVALPEGAYYYALDLGPGYTKPLNGSITLIR